MTLSQAGHTWSLLHTQLLYTPPLLHTDAFIQNHFYTDTLLHTSPFTQRRLYAHLLRTIFANSGVKCTLRAKTLQSYLTGMGRCEDPRKNHEATIAIASARCNKLEADTSLSTKPNRSPFDRLRQQRSKTWKPKNPNDRRARSRLSRLPLTPNWKLQVRLDGQSRYPTLWPSFVELGQSQSAQSPCKKRTTLEVLHLFRWFTHTHTH